MCVAASRCRGHGVSSATAFPRKRIVQITAVDFDSLSGISLRVSGSTFSDSIQVRLDVWLDVRYRDGRKSKWRSASFADQYQTVQAFIEAYGAYQAFRNAGQYPR